MATRRSSNAAGVETRQRLITVAERRFAESGIDAVSLRQIAHEAGLRNPAAVLYHFGDKDALVRAVLERRSLPINELRGALLDRLTAFGELSVRSIAEAMVLPLATELDGDGEYLGFLAQLARSHPHLLADPESPWYGTGVRKLLDALSAAGLRQPPVLEDIVVRFFTSSLPAVLADHQRATRAGVAIGDRQVFVSYLVDLFAATLAAAPSESTLELLKGAGDGRAR